MTIFQNDKKLYRSSATRYVLEKTDRILGQSHVKVEIAESGVPAPAYTDGKVITINANMNPVKEALSKGFTTKSIAITTALNYHELAHVMFTPRLGSDFVNKVRERGQFMSLNILEDQAAETRFVKLYEPSRHYFTSLVTNYMMENQQYLEANYVLVSGRLFLPKRVRKAFQDNFSKPDLIADIDRLVARYKTLVFPHDQTEMLKVVKEFHELITDTQPSNPGEHSNISIGSPDTKTTEQLQREVEIVNDEEDAGESESEEEEKKGKGESDEGEPDEGESGEGEGDDSEEGESESEGSGQDDAQGGSSERMDNEKPQREKKKAQKELVDALRDAVEEAIQEVEEELNNRIENIKDEEKNYRPDHPEDPSKTVAPIPEHMHVIQRCIDEFRQVEMRHAPGWTRYQRSGKLDPRRYAHALRGDENVFRRWREGVLDALDFEVVFLLDQSGSMMSRIETASRSLWILRRTFEECGGTVTTFGFHSEMTLLTQRGDKAEINRVPIFSARGSTYVQDAMNEARRVLNASTKPLKMCVSITDGGFHDKREAQTQVSNMGCPVAFIGINQDVSEWDGFPNVIHTEVIQDPAELVEVVKKLAINLTEKRMSRLGH